MLCSSDVYLTLQEVLRIIDPAAAATMEAQQQNEENKAVAPLQVTHIAFPLRRPGRQKPCV